MEISASFLRPFGHSRIAIRARPPHASATTRTALPHLALAAAALVLGVGPTLADQRCTVTDPTGTPLNVRSEPNGAILGALHNGAVVSCMETVADRNGRSWSFIVPLDGGKAGWVFREFVSCY